MVFEPNYGTMDICLLPNGLACLFADTCATGTSYVLRIDLEKDLVKLPCIGLAQFDLRCMSKDIYSLCNIKHTVRTMRGR